MFRKTWDIFGRNSQQNMPGLNVGEGKEESKTVPRTSLEHLVREWCHLEGWEARGEAYVWGE